MTFVSTLKQFTKFTAVAALATSAAAESLTVYTYESFVSEWGPGPQLEKAFEAQCNCDVNFIGVDDGVSILNRLKIEGANTKADILLGIDDGLMEEARSLKLVKSHQVKLDHLKDELKWQDTQFVPFDYGYFAFIYDSSKIKNPVTSLKALVQSDASVIYQDPRTSTPGQGMMTWMKSVYGADVSQAWQQLSGHTVTVTKGWWEAYSMFLEGEADYVLSYTTSPAYHVIAEGKNQYKAAPFSEGHVPQIEVAAISQFSKKETLANDFLTFLVSEEAQKIIPVTNWMLPVAKGIELPEAFDHLVQAERIGFSPDAIAANRQSWIKEWRTAVSN